ncbi:PD-(D/E)XK nuclease family protein [Eubacterium oxidoreducens]|uniref:DNA helicase/exodeoxyribonuclease V, subunit B n=1 Tax=Eubacterium oxidoreducens TaxID=1732 RepID=A0A1G6BMA3_EUBOX|nr:PD-(D/E)XK nuclease family protein [Eubacterium oxidoreducens]SDB21715.1 DNA helicase/exodeoxyribonuclease V, subunit B [Eubacterium oxidoreducens]
MALQFVLGRAGSGKSAFMYRRFLEEAKQSPKQQYLVIVPEQFTLQTQKDLVAMQPEHAILNLDILSFERLAYRVFEELGVVSEEILSETGKSLLLRSVAMEQEKHLKMLASNVQQMGFIEELKSILSELMQYEVTSEALLQISESRSDAAGMKVHDIAVLYGAFKEKLREKHYMASEEMLTKLAMRIEESKILRDAIVLLDGYTGFTPVQMQVLGPILSLSKKVYCTFTTDTDQPLYVQPKQHELFYLSGKSILALKKLAEETGCEIEDAILMEDGASKRYENAPELSHLETNLFRKKAQVYTDKCDNIRIVALNTPQEEIRYVARKVKQMVELEGYRYRDFAVISADMQSHGPYCRNIFEEYEIPYFLDQKQTLLKMQFVEVIRSVLEMIEKNFSRESVVRYLKSGYSGFSNEDTQILENYIRANGIYSYSNWTKKWIRMQKNMTQEQLAYLNVLRERLVEDTEQVRKIVGSAKETVRAKMTALYQFTRERNMPQKLKEWELYFAQHKERQLEREYAQVYTSVMQLFEKMVTLMGDECVKVSDLAKILDAGFASEKMGMIPAGVDHVMIGDIERSRLSAIKVVFFIGVNDGLVPKGVKTSGLLNGQDRKMLSDYKIELAPGEQEQAFVQRFYLYMALTKPMKKLFLTYALVDSSSKAMQKSYLIQMILNMFPNRKVESAQEELINRILTKENAFEELLKELEAAKTIPDDEVLWALNAYFKEDEVYKERLYKALKGKDFYYTQEDLDKDLARALYDKKMNLSITRLEQFAGCAFRHFLSYGLRLKEREQLEFDALDFGNILHKALEIYFKELKKEQRFSFDLLEEEKTRRITESFEAALEGQDNQALDETNRASYMRERMQRILKRSIWIIEKQTQESLMRPEEFEMTFSHEDGLDATKIDLNSGERLQLIGKIDRIDVREDEGNVSVQVVDYKTGAASFHLLNLIYGLNLQLPVYLKAAQEMMEQRYGERKMVHALAAYYFSVKDPIVKMPIQATQEEIEQKILDEEKLSGLDFTKIKFKKEDPSQLIMDYLEYKIAQLGDGIMGGQIKANPYEIGTDHACTYCIYKSVCGFDEKLAGCQSRILESSNRRKDEVFLDWMRGELDDGDKME